LAEKGFINEKTLSLSMIGRHFFKEGVWFVVGRDEAECDMIRNFENFIEDEKGKPAVYFSEVEGKDFGLVLQEAFSTGNNECLRDKLKEFKI